MTDLHEIGEMFALLVVPELTHGECIVYRGPKGLPSASARLARWAAITEQHRAKRAARAARRNKP